MPNPARVLHVKLMKLREQGTSDSRSAHGWDNQPREVIGREMVDDGRLLYEVRTAIEDLRSAGRDVSVFWRYFPEWVLATYAYPLAWVGQQSASLFEDADLDVLALLADAVDLSLSLPEESIRKLRGIVDDARDLLGEDDSLDERLRFYLAQLIQEIQQALAEEDDKIIGSFDLARAAERLWVGLHGAAGQSKERSGAWSKLADRFFWPTASGLLVALPGLTLQALTTGHH